MQKNIPPAPFAFNVKRKGRCPPPDGDGKTLELSRNPSIMIVKFKYKEAFVSYGY